MHRQWALDRSHLLAAMTHATVDGAVCGLVWPIGAAFARTPRSCVTGRWGILGQISDWVYFLRTQPLGHSPYFISWNLLSGLHSLGPDTVPGGNEASELSEEISGLHLGLRRLGGTFPQKEVPDFPSVNLV